MLFTRLYKRLRQRSYFFPGSGNEPTESTCRIGLTHLIDEAVALHKGEIDNPVTEDDLREWGIDPEEVPAEPHESDTPWFEE